MSLAANSTHFRVWPCVNKSPSAAVHPLFGGEDAHVRSVDWVQGCKHSASMFSYVNIQSLPCPSLCSFSIARLSAPSGGAEGKNADLNINGDPGFPFILCVNLC